MGDSIYIALYGYSITKSIYDTINRDISWYRLRKSSIVTFTRGNSSTFINNSKAYQDYRRMSILA